MSLRNNFAKRTLCLGLVVALAGCASVPVGPNVAVMPAPGKPFDQFQLENAQCKDYARHELGTYPDELAGRQVAGGALAGAAIGAVAGAVIGHGHSSAAAVGAGVGAIAGTSAGAGNANRSNMTLQHRYDIAYQQCMYAKGNPLPGQAMPRYLPPPPPRPRS
jgi:hypothetical protein